MDEPARGDGPTLARYYDLDLADSEPDIDMYLALAGAGDGSVLELACGTGRIAVALARAGYSVTGVDNDPDMLARARAAWAAVAAPGGPRRAGGVGTLTLVEADMTTVKVNDRFGLVVIAFNSLLLLPDRDAQKRALEVVAGLLAPDGRAIVDVWLPQPDDLALYDGRLVLDWIRSDTETGEWVSKSTSARYSAAAATATITTIFDAWRDGEPSRRTHRRDFVNFISRNELLTLHAAAGLEPQIVAGDYEMTPLEPDDERVIVVSGTKPARRRGPSVRRSSVRSAV